MAKRVVWVLFAATVAWMFALALPRSALAKSIFPFMADGYAMFEAIFVIGVIALSLGCLLAFTRESQRNL